MNKRVYFLMIVSFVIGMVELIISGILDLIADDLHITLGQAGFLITIFSLIFAIGGPILLVTTAKVERKKLTLMNLFIFLIGNIVTVLSTNYAMALAGRIISGLSGALLVILCLVMAPSMVEPKYRGRAIGTISMGVSGSLVLGVPIGLMLGNAFGWRAPFILISCLTVLSIIGVYFLMEKVEPKAYAPLSKMMASLKGQKIFFAQATTFLYMTGHTVLYAYFKPFIQTTTGLEGTWISIIYFLFGIAAVSGGGIGGTLADLFGTKRTILTSIFIFSIVFFVLPYMTGILPLFFVGIVIWGCLSWAISPEMQSYLIDNAPDTADVQQSLNNSSLHLGVAVGSLIGGYVIETFSVEQNALVGGILITLSLITAILSTRSKPLGKTNAVKV